MATEAICAGSVIGEVISHGVEATLLSWPELLPFRPTLEEIAEVNSQLNHLEREARDLSRRLDELGAEIADRLENGA